MYAKNSDIRKILEDAYHPPSLARLRWKNDAVPSRIMVAAHPKSGSTWITGALAKLTRYSVGRFCYAWSSNEQDLYPPALVVHKEHGEIAQMHIRATPHNVALIQDFEIKSVVLSRNVYDAVVSFARDIKKKNENSKASPGMHGYSFVWLSSLSKDASFEEYLDYSIDFFLPWYVNFLLSWESYGEHTKAIFLRYERIRENPEGEFFNTLERLGFDQSAQLDFSADPLSASSLISATKSETFSGLDILGASRVERIRNMLVRSKSGFCMEHADEGYM